MVQAHSEAAHRPGFFQRKAVQTLLPFFTSLAFHAGLVVLAATLYQAVTVITTISEPQGPVTGGMIDIDQDFTRIIDTGIHGVGEDRTRTMAQDWEPVDINPKSLIFKPGSAEQRNLNPGGSDGDTNPVFGLGNTTFGRNGRGSGQGGGVGDGFFDAPKGKPTSFGIRSDGKPPIFRELDDRKIVFVCDATGSMTPVFSSLRAELNRTVQRLGSRRVQFFNVIFFSDDRVLSLSPSLVRADASGKARAEAFTADATPRGLTNPLPAIRAAFAQNPDVIYVLTDGFDQVQDLSSVVKEFDVLNKDRKVRVHTILLGDGEPKELAEALKTIADKNGGTMKVVSKEDF